MQVTSSRFVISWLSQPINTASSPYAAAIPPYQLDHSITTPLQLSRLRRQYVLHVAHPHPNSSLKLNSPPSPTLKLMDISWGLPRAGFASIRVSSQNTNIFHHISAEISCQVTRPMIGSGS